MYKILDFDPYGKNGEPLVLPVESGLLKQASSDLHDEIKRFLSENTVDPKEYARAIVCSLGAFDAYGPNNNGDAFFEEDLLKIHPVAGVPLYKTYEIYGKPYKFHKNRPTDKAYGRVVLAVYNKKMKRLELVVDFSRKDAPDICDDLDRGILPRVSMGFDAEYDVCSICGNKARRRSEYCDHVRYHMMEILPDGRLVYVRNPMGKFFDISIVRVPADNIAIVMKKVASRNGHAFTKLSADRAVEEGYVQPKKANIKKRIPGKVTEVVVPEHHIKFIEHGVPLLQSLERNMPPELIAEMCKYPLEEIISTLVLFGIRLKPEEFQRIMLTKAGAEKLANDLENRGHVFVPDYSSVKKPTLTPSGKYINPSLARKIASYPEVIENRSYHLSYLAKRAFALGAGEFPREDIRVMRLKQKSDEHVPTDSESSSSQKGFSIVNNPVALLAGLGALYAGINWLGSHSDTQFDRFLRKRPIYIIPVIGSAIAAAEYAKRKIDDKLNKTSSANLLDSWLLRYAITIPAIYSLSYYANAKKQRGDNVGYVLDSVARNPLLWTIVGAEGMRLSAKSLQRLSEQLRKAASMDVISEYPAELIGEAIIYHVNDVVRKNKY